MSTATLADLRHVHRELAAIARGVCPEPPRNPSECERTRRQLALLADRLHAHLEAEAPVLASLASTPATRLATVVRRREAEALGESCALFNRRWNQPGAIERDANHFAATWEVLHGALGRLIAREEGDVYPLAESWEPQAIVAPASSGIPALDDDHAQVFALIGGLRAAIGGGETRTGAEIIASIVAYAERHFALEERLMQASAYPGLEDHRQEHFRANSIILGFRNDHLDGRNVGAEIVLRFLEGWLSSHIAHTDQAMVGHLRATGHAPA